MPGRNIMEPNNLKVFPIICGILIDIRLKNELSNIWAIMS